MSVDGLLESRSGFWTSLASLFTSTGTLVCCALPALLIGLGAGAALSSLVSAFPQIVWLSEHKEGLFTVAVAMTLAGGAMQWRNRTAPCPTAPGLRDACLRSRKTSARLYGASVAILLVGGWFAFVQPWLSA